MAGALKWLLPAATGFAGLAAGVLIGAHHADLPVAAFTPSGTASPVALTADDVRRVVREELAVRDKTPAGHAAAELPSSASPPPVTAQQVAAGSQAQSVLEGAIARRTWTDQDAEAMRNVFADLNGDQQSEFLQQYAVAVNQGRLVPQTERIPF